MKVLFDTNVVLDVLLARKDFVAHSAQVVGWAESRKIDGYLSAISLPTLDYLVAKAVDRKRARQEIRKLLVIFSIAEVNAKVLELSACSAFQDFEDAIQYYCAECCGAQALVTRNPKDYRSATLPVYTPEELIALLADV